MENRTNVVITPHGAFRETTAYTPIDINQGIINQLTTNITRRCIGILPGAALKNGPKWPIGITLAGGHNCWTVELNELIINTTFATTSDGKTIFPNFRDTKLPVMTVPWTVPDNMRLVLMLMIGKSNELHTQFFVAFDNADRIYTLPMGNIFEDGKLCYGPYAENRTTALDALQSAWSQFNTSRWQADLYNERELAKTQELFSFKVDNDKFIQSFPTDGSRDWTRYATKIANENISSNVALNRSK